MSQFAYIAITGSCKRTKPDPDPDPEHIFFKISGASTRKRELSEPRSTMKRALNNDQL